MQFLGLKIAFKRPWMFWLWSLFLGMSGSAALSQNQPLPFTSVVQVGQDFYFSGWGSRNPETGQHPEGFEAQTRQLMINLRNLIGKQNLSFSDVVHSTVLLTDMSRLEDFYRIYGEFMGAPLPAVQIAGIPRLPDTQVEITFIASRSRPDHVTLPGFQPSPAGSHAVRNGNLLYTSGSALLRPAPPGGSLQSQVRQALEDLGQVLRQGGLDYRNVVKAEVYLTDIRRIQEMNEVYQTFFPDDPPTRTTIGVTALPAGAEVSIALVASPDKQVIVPEGMTPSPNFSPAIFAGDRLFLSGKAGFAEGGVEAQVHEVMQGLQKTLQAAGLDFSHVVEAKVYVSNMDDYHQMNAAYRQYYPAGFPSRTCTQAQALVRQSTVEITLVGSRKR